MLASLQKAVVFVVLMAAACWGGLLEALGHRYWAVVGTLLILFGYAIFLGVEFIVLYRMQESTPVPRPSSGTLLRAWLAESICAPAVFFWRQPFRSAAEPDNAALPGTRRRGVVLVHGFVCNRGFWNPWMRRLRKGGVPFAAIDLEPVFGSIESYVALIERSVARMEADTGMAVVLIGHSMGGLAIRSWLARVDADARVHRVVTVGSPHRGTWLARFGHTTNTKQMRIGSVWLKELAARESIARYSRFTCFYGNCDNVVFPSVSATLPGADNRHIQASAHVHMAFNDAVIDEVLHWIGPDPTASADVRARATPRED